MSEQDRTVYVVREVGGRGVVKVIANSPRDALKRADQQGRLKHPRRYEAVREVDVEATA